MDPASVKLYFAIVLFFDMVEVEMDVVAAFPSVPLQGAKRGLYIDWITPPHVGDGLEIGNLQGIKQAGYNFHAWIDGWLKSKGMEPALADPCFYRRQVGTALLFLIIHVDDS